MRNNKQLEQKVKWIGVTGITGLDTLISVYNEDGIKAAGVFNNKKVYTFEISVKLKLLGLSANDVPKFTYHMKVNGSNAFGGITFVSVTSASGENITNTTDIQNKTVSFNSAMQNLSAPTDFWGEYTLAKK
jgi:hypothetical protein